MILYEVTVCTDWVHPNQWKARVFHRRGRRTLEIRFFWTHREATEWAQAKVRALEAR